MERSRILVVDDEESIRDLVRDILEDEKYELLEASDGDEALAIAGREALDLVVLDVNMPGLDGFTVLRRLQETGDVPVIMLSVRDDQADRRDAARFGANDYITKPFRNVDLIRRVEAVLQAAPKRDIAGQGPFDDGYLRIDFGKHVVRVEGREAGLTRTEYALLKELVASAGRVLEYDVLLKAVWGPGYEDARDSLQHHMGSLRRKIGNAPGRAGYIINLTGVGYRFNTER